MPISKNSAGVVALLKHAIEQCKDIDIDKPRVKHPTNRNWYHFDIVAVCKAWVEGERAYAEKVDRLTALAAASGCAERAVEVKAIIAERAPLMRNSCSRHLTLVREELKEMGYKWWEDFTDPELHLGNINKQTVEEIWNGPRYREFRRNMFAGKYADSCKDCYVLVGNPFYQKMLREKKD